MKLNRKLLSLAIVFAGLILVAYGVAFSSSSEITVLKVVKGEEALALTKSIHIGNFEIKNAVVMELEGEGKIRLWIAWAENETQAKKFAERMAEKVYPYFAKPEVVEISGVKVFRTEGNGRIHYFFSHEDRVFWFEFETDNEGYQLKVVKELGIDDGWEKFLN